MARYIDAEQIVLKLLSVTITTDLYGQGISAGIDQSLRIIKEQPTADVVEVVRCKDCEYYKKSVSALFPGEVAHICDNPYGIKKNPEEKDFCSYGERKENEIHKQSDTKKVMETVLKSMIKW